MKSIQDSEQEFIKNFNALDDRMLQFEYLLGLAGRAEPLCAEEKTDQNLFKDCQAKVWLIAEHKEDKLHIRVDSDSLLLKGVLCVFAGLIGGKPLESVVRYRPEFIEKTPIKQLITADRYMGIHKIADEIKRRAEDWLSDLPQPK